MLSQHRLHPVMLIISLTRIVAGAVGGKAKFVNGQYNESGEINGYPTYQQVIECNPLDGYDGLLCVR